MVEIRGRHLPKSACSGDRVNSFIIVTLIHRVTKCCILLVEVSTKKCSPG